MLRSAAATRGAGVGACRVASSASSFPPSPLPLDVDEDDAERVGPAVRSLERAISLLFTDSTFEEFQELGGMRVLPGNRSEAREWDGGVYGPVEWS